LSIEARLDRIPDFVSARTPLALRREMLRMNVKYATQLTWHYIQFVDGKWFAWFYRLTNGQVSDDNGTR
jgi:hypothetical protein